MDHLLSRAEALARHSDSPEHYTRTWLTPAHQAAARQIAAWMREAGMEVRVDAVGNVIGRHGAGGKRLLIGSHFDSVRNGGKYDGVLGVLLPIGCFAELDRRGERVESNRLHDVKSAPCATWLQDAIEGAIRAAGADPMRLPSGAGHDAMVLAEITDVGMMFVRCGAGGVSHNPAEIVTAGDVALAHQALLAFLRGFLPPA